MRRASLMGSLGGALLLILLILWLTYTQIAGAVVASGTVAVTGKPKTVQHLDGGIVAEILVRDGDLVQRGDVLMRLDDTLLRANLEIYRNRVAEALTRRDRLIAERNGDPLPQFRDDPLLAGRDMAPIREGERAIFEARAEIQRGSKAQLEERIRQFGHQIEGVNALIASKRDQAVSLERELDQARKMREKGLAREPQILTLERSHTDLLGQIAEHLSEVARIRNSIEDTRLEILQTARQFREQAVTELRDVTVEIEEMVQQILTTQKQLERVNVTAPETGLVHELQIVTKGGVVAPGGAIAQIIAADEARSFEFRVAPVAIDQIWPGQPVRLHFSAFNSRTTPELRGTVRAVSPSTVMDEATGQSYYRVFADVPPDQLALLGGLTLVPGMPVEGVIGTQEQSVLAWLVRPITDQFRKAFREE